MALDTITIKQIVSELNKKITDAKIEKIHQPEKDEIVLIIKSQREIIRLVISANASQPRIHFTTSQKENPLVAPMFCMLLRKHLQGGKIICVNQIDYERIIRIDVDSYDELGDLTRKYLFCEMMGRHSNIILTKQNLTVIDSIKHIDFSLSSVRQILPGLTYCPPPAQEKIPILSPEFSDIELELTKEGKKADKEILDKISGISPLNARECVFRATSTTNKDCFELSNSEKDKILIELNNLLTKDISPCIITDTKSGKVIDFSPFEIYQYGEKVSKTYFSTLNELMDEFYKEKDNVERMKQKSSDLIRTLTNNIDRVAKKITILKKTLDAAASKEEYKINGDLLTSNLYKFSQGDDSVFVKNYYDINESEIKISLNPQLTPSQNAQRYYKLYQKAKNAEIEAKKQLDTSISDLDYLESTLVLVKNAQTEADINAVRIELADLGYIKIKSTKKKQKEIAAKPHHFISSDGLDIYVGRNNTQNDWLTLKFANSQDLWFHTKKIHGSHTIIKLGVNKEVPNNTIKEAAMLAAYYSKARESSNVPVDYTIVKNVKKPNGAKPGMVIYDNYNTIYVNPKIPDTVK